MEHPLFDRISSHSALKQTNEHLRSDLKNAKITVMNLQDKLRKQQHDAVKRAQDENATLRSKLAASEQKINMFIQQAEDAEQRREDLQKQLKDVTGAAAKASAVATEASSAAAAANTRYDELVKETSAEADAAKTRYDELVEKTSAAADEAKTRHDELVEKTSAAADAAHAHYDDLVEQTSTAAQEATQKFEALQKQYADTLEKLRKTENDLGKMTLAMQSHQADFEAVAEMTKVCEQSKAELETLRLGAKSAAEELQKAHDDFGEMSAKFGALSKRHAETVNELGEMSTKFGALSKRHAEIVNEIKGMRVDHDALVEGVQRTSAELETSTKRVKYLEELIEDIKALSEKKDLEAIISVLNKEKDEDDN